MNAFFNGTKCGSPKMLTDQVKSLEKQFPTLGDECRGGKCLDEARPLCFRTCLRYDAVMLCNWHFGFRGKLRPEAIMNKGVELAQMYFTLIGARLAKAKQKVNWKIAWFVPYSEALLLTTLAGCPRERTEISDFLHPNLAVESEADPIEPALGDALLCIAASFQSSPKNTTSLEKRLRKCSKKHPKLLFETWQALKSEERAKFVSALAESTATFARTAADDHPYNAVAMLESILAGLAYERGWRDLSFELPIAARLVTHQSLEIG